MKVRYVRGDHRITVWIERREEKKTVATRLGHIERAVRGLRIGFMFVPRPDGPKMTDTKGWDSPFKTGVCQFRPTLGAIKERIEGELFLKLTGRLTGNP